MRLPIRFWIRPAAIAVCLALMLGLAAAAAAWQQTSPSPAADVIPAGANQEKAGESPTPAPRVLTPQAAQPISIDAAQRNEPATVFIQDDSPPPPRSSAKVKTGSSAGNSRLSIPDSKPAEEASKPAKPASAPAITVEAASLKGVQPGVTTKDQVQAVWGEPKRVDRYPQHEEHLHQMEPFEQVIVAYQQDKVSTIVVHLQAPLKSEMVRAQLGMDDLEPALVFDPAGKLLGQVFPERGVLFSYQAGAAELLVKQIVLEGIHPQPFALRAEGRLATHWTSGLKDVEQALKLDPRFARAHWLKAQLLSASGRTAEALKSAEEAVRLEGGNVEYRITRARLYQASGETARAASEAKTAVSQATTPLAKAQALSLQADLAAAAGPRNQTSVSQRQEVIDLLEPLLAEGQGNQTAVRELLLEAHLSTAHDIAWGPWNQKPQVVPKWIAEASSIAEEDHPNAATTRQRKLRIARAALAALAGLQGEVDPTLWIETLESATQEAFDATDDSLRRAQLQWDLGVAEYSAMQIYHARGDSTKTLRCGGKAQTCLTQVAELRGSSNEHNYLLGRVYFRTGAAHAVLKNSHTQAVSWYERALPLMSDTPPSAEIGRHGESLVSMGVSYWEAGQRPKGLELTSQGLSLMQKAVGSGQLEENALSVPYGNLAQMHRRLGDAQAAGKFAQMASRSQTSLK